MSTVVSRWAGPPWEGRGCPGSLVCCLVQEPDKRLVGLSMLADRLRLDDLVPAFPALGWPFPRP